MPLQEPRRQRPGDHAGAGAFYPMRNQAPAVPHSELPQGKHRSLHRTMRGATMYLYDSPASLHQFQSPRMLGTLSRFGEPLPAPSPDLVIDDFDFDRADLKKSHKDMIDKLEQQIVDSWKPGSNRPALGVRVVGHTDLVGGEKYNLDLGNRRAEKVLGRLTGLIAGGDIDIYRRMTWSRTSQGKASPRSPVPAKNRRGGEFFYRGRGEEPPRPTAPPR